MHAVYPFKTTFFIFKVNVHYLFVYWSLICGDIDCQSAVLDSNPLSLTVS